MPLPTSGQIDLNAIHVEAGGTTGTAATINDTDIRGLVGVSSGVAMDFADWYGASGNDEDTTFTGGSNSQTLGGYKGVSAGAATTGTFGSYTDRVFDVGNGSNTVYAIYRYSTTSGKETFIFIQLLLQSGATTSSFSNLILPNGTLSESSAQNRASSTGGYKGWLWNLNDDASGISGGLPSSGSFDVDWS